MLILPVTDGEELVVFREVLQEPTPELGDYIYREGIVRQGMPATQQAEVIRESLDKGASALIVFTSEPEAVGPALAETREAGTPVVVIGREVPVEGDPLPLLAFPPPDETAQRLFASLASGAGSTASAEGPRAVILTRASQGWRLDPLAEVLEGAAAEAGVTVAQVLPYEKTVESARVSLADAIREDPAIDLILFDDATGAEAAALIAEDPELNPEQRLRFGGFVADLAPGLLERLGDGAVVADRQVSEGARRAVALVLEMLDGGEVPDRVEIETVVVGPSSSNEAEPSDSEAP